MNTRVHPDWSTAGFDLPPVADTIGPFAGRDLLRAWWTLRGRGQPVILESPNALVAMEQVGDDVTCMLGEADLFDYHSPLGAGAMELLAEWAGHLPAGHTIDLDSLPGAAADVAMAALQNAGHRPVAEVHESAAILELAGDFDGYLAGLGKKQRHETRRKTRRFADALGEPRLIRESGPNAVGQFAALHRLADGRKGTFMTQEMEQLFAEYHRSAAATIDFLYGMADEPVAAAFGFEDESTYYLYNSAYDPDAGAASPGIVLVAELIKRTIASGRSRLDFLKGDEVYKYRLGATARPLWRVRARVGGPV